MFRIPRNMSVVFQPKSQLMVRAKWPKEYIARVAVLSTDLDEVFRLTNDDDLSDKDRKRVKWLSAEPRSMMIGDVVVDSCGSVYRCENRGWTLIESNALEV